MSRGLPLFEQVFRRDGKAIDDLRGTVGDFQQPVAQWTAELARMSLARNELDPANAGVAFGADDVAFLHASDYALIA